MMLCTTNAFDHTVPYGAGMPRSIIPYYMMPIRTTDIFDRTYSADHFNRATRYDAAMQHGPIRSYLVISHMCSTDRFEHTMLFDAAIQQI